MERVVSQIFHQIQDSILIVIGGTDDLVYPITKAIASKTEENKLNLINIDS